MTGPLKWHGGKSYLAANIIGLFPPRCKNPNKPAPDDDGWLHYVEPYFGGGAVLLANDPEGISEVVNDLNCELTNFWACLQSPEAFATFTRRLDVIPFSEIEFEGANVEPGLCWDQMGGMTALAVNFFIRCRQSLSGRMKGFAGITRNRTRKGMNEQVSAWLNCIEGLPAVHARLIRVLIRNKPALEIIAKEDGPRTLFYLDPPYLHETRATTGDYEHEMTYAQHRELLEALKCVKGRFLLSGYNSDLYCGYANTVPRWNRHDFEIDNKASGGKTKRKMTECVWTNF